MAAEKGEYRSIYVSLLDDPDFQELSAAARACLWTLKLKLGLAGIAPFQPETLPRYTGFSAAETEAALEELAATRWLALERTVYWIRNGLRHDPAEPLRSPNQVKGIVAYLRTLPKLPIVNAFATYYGLETPFPELNGSALNGNPPGTLSEGVTKPFLSPEPETEPETEGRSSSGAPAREGQLDLEPPTDLQGDAQALIRTANAGMADNPALRDSFRPIPVNHGSLSNVLEWLQEGIPTAVISETVLSVAQAYRPQGSDKQIHSMLYFDRAVRKAFEKHLARTNGGRNGKHTSASRSAGSAAGAAPGDEVAVIGGRYTRRRRARG